MNVNEKTSSLSPLNHPLFISLPYNMPNHKSKFLKNGYIPYATQEIPTK